MIPMNNVKLSARELRRHLNRESEFVTKQLAPSVGSLLHNDQVTQARILKLEARLDAFNSLTRWQRLKWLLAGVL